MGIIGKFALAIFSLCLAYWLGSMKAEKEIVEIEKERVVYVYRESEKIDTEPNASRDFILERMRDGEL